MCRFLKAVGDETYELLDLRARDAAVPLDDVVDACALGKTFKDDGNGQAGVAQHPCAVDPLGARFYNRTLRPIYHKVNYTLTSCPCQVYKSPMPHLAHLLPSPPMAVGNTT